MRNTFCCRVGRVECNFNAIYFLFPPRDSNSHRCDFVFVVVPSAFQLLEDKSLDGALALRRALTIINRTHVDWVLGLLKLIAC
jgi:hypothetical protein